MRFVLKIGSLIIRIHHFDINLVNTEVDGQEAEKYNKSRVADMMISIISS
jgi:hypothetical protein